MQVFDVKAMVAYPYEERDRNVFYSAKEFQARIIELPPGGEIPTCEMASYVTFYVVEGTAEISVNQEKVTRLLHLQVTLFRGFTPAYG